MKYLKKIKYGNLKKRYPWKCKLGYGFKIEVEVHDNGPS
jgi:hypothetical protein